MSDFGDLLKRFRERAEFSQRALAKSASIDTSYISRLEKGEREVTSRSLALKIAGILELSQREIDLWLISAGYVSPRIQKQGLNRLYEEMGDWPIEATEGNE